MGKRKAPDTSGMTLLPKGVRRSLLLAFVLMSAVPLVMLLLVSSWFAFPVVREFYHLDKWFPLIATPSSTTWWLTAVIALTVAVSLLGGIYLTMRLVEPLIRISQDAKELVKESGMSGSPDGRQDELGNITLVLNQLMGKIRNNMSELKQFGDRTTQLNYEIHKRVVTLAGLLQISELVSNGITLDAVLDMVVDKVASLEEESFSFLCLEPLEDVPLTLRRSHGVAVTQLSGLVIDTESVVIDDAHQPTGNLKTAWEQLDRPNLIMQPVRVRQRCVGTLGVGNRRASYRWGKEQLDLIKVFVQQTSIAMEKELLVRRTKALAVHDELTGVYNERHFRQRLDEEIKRAVMYQRPCALAMFAIQGLVGYRERHGEPEAERALKKITRLVQDSVSEIDQVGRFHGNQIAILLPEQNKREAMELATEIRRRVAFAFASSADRADQLGLIGGVSENPVDGVTSEELIGKAFMSTQQGQDPEVPPVGREG